MFVQFRDMPPGSNFVNEMQRGIAGSARFIAVLSPAYVVSDHCQAEWAAAYASDPGGRKRYIVPFLIEKADLAPLARQIVFKSLEGLSRDAAREAILEAIGHAGAAKSPEGFWPPTGRSDLAAAASPSPSLTSDKRLDAGPNIEFDKPIFDKDLPSLPMRQQRLIHVILSDLPRQTPKHLRTALNDYGGELKARGVQPILGVLKDMAFIIDAAVKSGDAPEWLADGMIAAFQRFNENHADFVRHFPLDLKRETLYATTPVEEQKIDGAALRKPFDEVAKASAEALKNGAVTENFDAAVKGFAEHASVFSTQPPAPPVDSPALSVNPDDRLLPPPPEVTPKKRIILSWFGFLERAYNLAGSTATLAGPPAGNSLLEAIRKSLDMLSKMLGL